VTSPNDYFDEGIFERRETVRSPCYRGALIRFPGILSIVSCAVREASDRGASIRLHRPALLPLEFDLSDDNFKTINRCRLVWREGFFIGVEFRAIHMITGRP
jgi:hypothetical protein